jgi:hypothetical protein
MIANHSFQEDSCGLIETADLASAVSLKPLKLIPRASLRPWRPIPRSLSPCNRNIANDYLHYLGEYEAICVTVQPVNQGRRGDSLMKKIKEQKSLGAVPLNIHIFKIEF